MVHFSYLFAMETKSASFIARHARILLFLFIAGFIAFFSYLSIARHDNFHSRRLDLGNMEQTVWNIAHGNGFTLTDPMGSQNISRLGVHADFLLILISPLYRIWSDARTLLLLQVIVIGLGALPVYWIAKETLRSKPLALFFAGAYLLYPPLERMTLHDFHAVSLSMTFLLFAYWYMRRQHYWLFAVFAVLAGLGKENIWITIGLMGLYIAFVQKHRLLGLVIAGIGFGLFYFLYWYAIPYALATHQHFAVAYLSEFGENQNGIVIGVLKHPFNVLSDLLKIDRLEYYATLLFPLGFLPLLAPFSLLFALPSLLINALSNNGLMRIIDYQYTSDITPFLFVSAISGFSVLRSFLSRKKIRIARIGLATTIVACFVGIGSYLWGEVPLTRQDRFYFFIWPTPEKESMEKVEKLADSKYTVSVTNNIGAHFAKRKYLYNFPVNATTSDFAIALLGDQYAWPSGDAQQQAVQELLASKEYTLIVHDGDFYAFKRNGIN